MAHAADGQRGRSAPPNMLRRAHMHVVGCQSKEYKASASRTSALGWGDASRWRTAAWYCATACSGRSSRRSASAWAAESATHASL